MNINIDKGLLSDLEQQYINSDLYDKRITVATLVNIVIESVTSHRPIPDLIREYITALDEVYQGGFTVQFNESIHTLEGLERTAFTTQNNYRVSTGREPMEDIGDFRSRSEYAKVLIRVCLFNAKLVNDNNTVTINSYADKSKFQHEIVRAYVEQYHSSIINNGAGAPLHKLQSSFQGFSETLDHHLSVSVAIHDANRKEQNMFARQERKAKRDAQKEQEQIEFKSLHGSRKKATRKTIAKMLPDSVKIAAREMIENNTMIGQFEYVWAYEVKNLVMTDGAHSNDCKVTLFVDPDDQEMIRLKKNGTVANDQIIFTEKMTALEYNRFCINFWNEFTRVGNLNATNEFERVMSIGEGLSEFKNTPIFV
ncbi:hypothetical protein [Vibrio sp. WXL210]|uniref:hypothetical protein n=1 Tax=Vibrio sp. WXL210 TaxID=3450709 RepID=UPI003EC661AC